MTAKDKYKIALNIAARVGMDGNLIGEFAKTMSALHGVSSQEQLTNMQNMAQNAPNTPVESTISPPTTPSTQPDQSQPEIGKYDNL